MKMKVEDFREKFCGPENKHGLYVPEDIMMECAGIEFKSILNDTEAVIDIPDNLEDIVNTARAKDEKRESEYKAISAHRLAGMQCEEDGDIDEAVKEYAQSISLGLAAENDMLHAFHHSFNRIFVLLDKMKRYAEESEYITSLLSFNLDDLEREKLTARLDKVRVKLEKQSRNG